ncbi:MAG TPA: hypothetical protein VFK30_07805, partial [Anaerolineae bacterium]|nr:hypothetical protein [Anaerolineae bacterium]
RNHGVIARAVLNLNRAMVAGLFVFALTDSFVIALIAYWTLTSTRETLIPLYTTWVNQHVESSVRATVISMTSQIDALGQIIGGPIVGFIGTTISIGAALAASGLILALAMPLLIKAIRTDQRTLALAAESTAVD